MKERSPFKKSPRKKSRKNNKPKNSWNDGTPCRQNRRLSSMTDDHIRSPLNITGTTMPMMDDIPEVLMAIKYENETISIAVFMVSNFKLLFGQIQEIEKYEEKRVVEQLKIQFNPDVILLYSYILEFNKNVRKSLPHKHVACEMIPTHESNNDHADDMTGMLGLDQQIKQELSKYEEKHNAKTDAIYHSIGSLIKYCAKNNIYGIHTLLREDNNMTETSTVLFREISWIDFDGYMRISYLSMKALNIFKTEVHPSRYITGIRTEKEGVSLFSVLNHTVTSIGASLLKKWMMTPSMDPKVLEDRFNTIEYLLQPEIYSNLAHVQKLLKNCYHTGKLIHKLKMAVMVESDWHHLLNSIKFFNQVGQKVTEIMKYSKIHSTPPIISKIEQFMNQHLFCMNSSMGMIESIIDFDASKKATHVVVKPSIDQDLDGFKNTYLNLSAILDDAAIRVRDAYPFVDFEYQVVYFAQLGYLTMIDHNPENETPSIEGFEFHFMTDENVYYKNNIMHQLDEEIGDIYGMIIDKEDDIVRNVEDHILKNVEGILRIGDLAAHLDCFISLAIVARKNNYVKPNLVLDEPCCQIIKSRHPILEEEMRAYDKQPVANDIQMFKPNILFMTGPNGSGKSVYLKQIGLLIYMVQIGCFVPAESASVSLTDQIFTRIISNDSISNQQSSFCSDLLQIKNMVDYATSSSLLLIDEFGKGTLAKDGIALLSSVVNFFHTVENECPKAVVTTHFSEILEYEILKTTPYLRHITLNSEIKNKNKSNSGIVYKYEVVDGLAIPSYGILCAHAAALPNDVTNRATNVAFCMEEIEPIQPLDIDESTASQYDAMDNFHEYLFYVDLDKPKSDPHLIIHNLRRIISSTSHVNNSKLKESLSQIQEESWPTIGL